jgi:hypothetical protein
MGSKTHRARFAIGRPAETAFSKLTLRQVQRAAQDIAEGAGRLPDQETEDKQR